MDKIYLNAGKYKRPVYTWLEGDRIFFKFGYNKPIMTEIKESMSNPRYHGYDKENPRKLWSAKYDSRTRFTLSYLMGNNPYEHYRQDIPNYDSPRPLLKHQKYLIAAALKFKHVLWVADPGTGKTLSFIEVAEQAEAYTPEECWYVGPVIGVTAVRRELRKWGARIRPLMLTYQGLVSHIKNGPITPRLVCFDESTALKSPKAQRSISGFYLADQIREEYGFDSYIILMTGTPSPKSPLDWWHQAEVACPGYLRENNIHLLKDRLALTEQRMSAITGQEYPHLITWLNDEKKCIICGEYEDHENHDSSQFALAVNENDRFHPFKPSKNEVASLGKRLTGLVTVVKKEEALDLPEKQYLVDKVKPTPDILRAANTLINTVENAAHLRILLRQLSDGFQYTKEIIGYETCPVCDGKKVVIEGDPIEDVTAPNVEVTFTMSEKECPCCKGKGEVPSYKRSTDKVESPKLQRFIEYLEEYESIGRFLVWGAFTGTIDALTSTALSRGWYVLQVDGRGQHAFVPSNKSTVDVDTLFDCLDRSHPRTEDLHSDYPRVCFVGQPDSAGQAITLTSCPTGLYCSNSDRGESRSQSEDRIHRVGMDTNRACQLIDLVMLPSDLLILENLKRKKNLEDISVEQIRTAFSKGLDYE